MLGVIEGTTTTPTTTRLEEGQQAGNAAEQEKLTFFLLITVLFGSAVMSLRLNVVNTIQGRRYEINGEDVACCSVYFGFSSLLFDPFLREPSLSCLRDDEKKPKKTHHSRVKDTLTSVRHNVSKPRQN